MTDKPRSHMALDAIIELIVQHYKDASILEAKHMRPDCSFDDETAYNKYAFHVQTATALETLCCRNETECNYVLSAVRKLRDS